MVSGIADLAANQNSVFAFKAGKARDFEIHERFIRSTSTM
jgi:hypothetical protein